MTSCSSYYSRSYTEGYVYDYKTKEAVKGAEILILEENKYVFETKTNLKGYFNFKEKKHTKLGYNSRDLATRFIIKKENFISETLSSYGGNDITRYDSIFLKQIKDKTLSISDDPG